MKKVLFAMMMLALAVRAGATNLYCNLTGQIGSLFVQTGYAFSGAVTFKSTSLALPACGTTIPVAPSYQTYYTDKQGNLPPNVELQQGMHVTMTVASSTIPLIIPCQTSINIAELIPAQTPLPDAVSAIILQGPLYQGTSVTNPAVGTVGPATLTAPASQPYVCNGVCNVDCSTGPIQDVTLNGSSTINLLANAPPLMNGLADGKQCQVDTIQNATGGYAGIFAVPAGYTLQWAGGGSQPVPATTASTVSVWNFTVLGTTVVGSLGQLFANGLTSVSGIADIGRVTITQAPTPTNPSVSAIGTTGATSYTYYDVCNDYNGGKTLPSAATTITNGSSVLSGTNYNQVCPVAEAGCGSWDILKGNTGTLLVTLNAPSGCINDQGQATTVYSTPTRNTTADIYDPQGNITGNLLTLSNGPLTVGSVFSVSTGGNITASGSLIISGLVNAQGATLTSGLTAGGAIISTASISATNGFVAGGLGAGSGFVGGDATLAESASTGRLWFGTGSNRSLDYGIANAGEFTLTGGGLAVSSLTLNGSPISNTPTMAFSAYQRTHTTTNGGAVSLFVPAAAITFTSIDVTVPAGETCSVTPTVQIWNQTDNVFSNAVSVPGSGHNPITAFNVPAGKNVEFYYTDGTCGSPPADITYSATYKMQ